MIFNNSRLSLSVLSLILAVLIAGAVFIVYNIKFTNTGTTRLLNEAKSVAEARNLSQSILLVQKEAAEDLADFNKIVLTGDKLVFLIEDVEKTGRALGLETNIISVGNAEENNAAEPEIIRMVIETQGAWAPTLAFLRAMENLPHRVMIDESSLSKVDNAWHFKIVLSLYSFK